jgi:hypothetical protein
MTSSSIKKKRSISIDQGRAINPITNLAFFWAADFVVFFPLVFVAVFSGDLYWEIEPVEECVGKKGSLKGLVI